MGGQLCDRKDRMHTMQRGKRSVMSVSYKVTSFVLPCSASRCLSLATHLSGPKRDVLGPYNCVNMTSSCGSRSHSKNYWLIVSHLLIQCDSRSRHRDNNRTMSKSRMTVSQTILYCGCTAWCTACRWSPFFCSLSPEVCYLWRLYTSTLLLIFLCQGSNLLHRAAADRQN